MGSTPGNMKKLTGKQEAFAQAYVLNGGNATKAYRDSYSSSGMTEGTLWNEASRTLANPEVTHRIEELRLPVIKESIASIEQRKEFFLTRVIHGEELDIGQFGQKVKPKLATKLRAVDLLNQMEGVYITKVEAKTAQVIRLVVEVDPQIGGCMSLQAAGFAARFELAKEEYRESLERR